MCRCQLGSAQRGISADRTPLVRLRHCDERYGGQLDGQVPTSELGLRWIETSTRNHRNVPHPQPSWPGRAKVGSGYPCRSLGQARG